MHLPPNILPLLLALPLASASCPYATSSSSGSSTNARRTNSASTPGKCARSSNVAGGGTRSADFWPCSLNLNILRQDSGRGPLGSYDYAEEFKKLDVDALKSDLLALMTTDQPFYPADFNHYGPLFVRLAWHSAGTYRALDGNGGSSGGLHRFSPLYSWPDNAGLDKALRLLWPIKRKFGRKVSWADLIVFTGNVALESMGFTTYGFAFGRDDAWGGDESIYWGAETAVFASEDSDAVRYGEGGRTADNIDETAEKLEEPLSSSNMGLIYVDPRGPHGVPDPLASAKDIRVTFGRMGMDDEETVALIAGGHAFGKTHGAEGGLQVGPEPAAAGIERGGLGWQLEEGRGVEGREGHEGQGRFVSGLEVVWSDTPTNWTNGFFTSLLNNNWTLVTTPSGAPQWEALDGPEDYPDPFDSNAFRRPMMLTSDLALIRDPVYHNISQTFFDDFEYFGEKFALAWYKLLHRDLPLRNHIGPFLPTNPPLLWQDPLPAAPAASSLINDADIASLKNAILEHTDSAETSRANLLATAWASASSFRKSDGRGGTDGGRIALEPMSGWEGINPVRVKGVLDVLREIRTSHNAAQPSRPVSLADLIVLGGVAVIEQAVNDAGLTLDVPFRPGRVDATQDMVDVESFVHLEPPTDPVLNYGRSTAHALAEENMLALASRLNLSAAALTVLIGGMRSIGATYDGSALGLLTATTTTTTAEEEGLSNAWFGRLLDMSIVWTPVTASEGEGGVADLFEGRSRGAEVSAEAKVTASRVDLVFTSEPELRALAEYYGADDAGEVFMRDFVAAWAGVMELGR